MATIFRVYVILLVVALAVALWPGGDSTGGVFAIILTLPWSILLLMVFDAIDPGLLDSWGPLLAVVGGLANAAILYLFAFRRKPRSTGSD